MASKGSSGGKGSGGAGKDNVTSKPAVVESSDSLGFYAAPGRFTTLSQPFTETDVGRVVEIVQGLLVYDIVATPFYGIQLTDDQVATIQERDSERLLAAAVAVDDRPISEPRAPSARVGGRCHTFSRMTVAFLRAAGVPARARCGFGAYFRPGWLEDHWVAEYWNPTETRWQMVDAQLDDVWCKVIGNRVNPLSIASDEFVTAGHAWQAWRRGELDAERRRREAGRRRAGRCRPRNGPQLLATMRPTYRRLVQAAPGPRR